MYILLALVVSMASSSFPKNLVSNVGASPRLDSILEQATASIGNIDEFLETCPTPAELQTLETDFPIYTLGPVASNRPYQCTEPVSQMSSNTLSDSLGVYQALRVIQRMKLNKPLPWTNLTPYDWLRSKIDGIAISDSLAVNDANARAYCCISTRPGTYRTIVIRTQAAPSEGALNTLTDYQQFMVPVICCGPLAVYGAGGVLGLVLLIMHEARHVDLPHNCGIRDSDLQYLGAWAVQYYTVMMMAQDQIEVGVRNSPNAGGDILGMVLAAQGLASSAFCTPLTPTDLKFDFEPRAIDIGATPAGFTSISATLTPAVVGRSITVLYYRQNPANTSQTISSGVVGTALTDASGRVVVNWTPQDAGPYYLSAVFPGDDEFAPSLRFYVSLLTVTKTTITSSVTKSTSASGTTESAQQTTRLATETSSVASGPESMIQQSVPVVAVGALILLVVLVGAFVVRGRRKLTQPPMAATRVVIYCGQCGTQNPTTDQFCTNCGGKLNQSK